MQPKTQRQRRNVPTAPRRRRGPDSGAPVAVDMGELPGLVGYALRRAQLVIFQDFYRTFAEVRIRPAQFSILTILERNPGLKQTDVAAVLGIKRTNFVVLLDELERRGLAQRRAAAGDRRSSALYLTEKGRALVRKLKKMVVAHDKRVTACIGIKGRKQLFKLLHRLAAEPD
jgi:DNA-binding MarR family transcriptional regulator